MRIVCNTEFIPPMEINPKTRRQLRLQSWLFLVLLLTVVGLLGWLSQRYQVEADWTASGRNSLSEASIALLERMPEPVTVLAFARQSELLPTRQNIRDFIGRYRKYKPDLELTFIDPDTAPEQTRKLGITVDGELVVSYQGRSEHVTVLKEETFTNTLQRLLRGGGRKLVFLDGHGERKPDGHANHDLQLFSEHLASKGIESERLNLSTQPAIPAQTALLVIASPQVAYLPGEVKLIRDYVKAGGNLLWLHDPQDEPGKLHGLKPLADDLGIGFVPGVIVDPTTRLLGIDDPSFALVASYGDHPVTRNFGLMTLYPRASGIEVVSRDPEGDGNWQATPILQTVERSWSETGPLEGRIEFDPATDVPGPLTLGLALSRPHPAGKAESAPGSSRDTPSQAGQQRVAVIGDGDFLSNSFLGNQGNQALGARLINWLSHDDHFITIPVSTAPDTELVLSETAWSWLGLLFLFGLPLLLLGSGVTIWWRRRQR